MTHNRLQITILLSNPPLPHLLSYFISPKLDRQNDPHIILTLHTEVDKLPIKKVLRFFWSAHVLFYCDGEESGTAEGSFGGCFVPWSLVGHGRGEGEELGGVGGFVVEIYSTRHGHTFRRNFYELRHRFDQVHRIFVTIIENLEVKVFFYDLFHF